MRYTDEELKALATEVNDTPITQIGDLYDKLVAMLNAEPDDVRVRFLFGAVCNRAKHYGIAKSMLEPLLRTHGHWGALRVNYGMALDYLGDYAGALNSYRHAEQDKKVDYANLYNNRASVLIKLGRYEEASAEADKALAVKPEFKEARINKGFARIAMGDLEIGWDNYEAASGSHHRISIDYGVPKWHGEAAARVIVHGEQGLGDEIMYASCLPDVLACTEAVAFDCDAKLSKLFRRSFPDAVVYGSRNARERPWVKEFAPTHSIGIGSLPAMFRRRREDFIPRVYLKPDPALVKMYRTLFIETSAEPRRDSVVGIAWSGGGPDTKEQLREIPLEAFAPLVEKYPRASFVSLQYREDAQAQIDAADLPIQHHHFATGKGSSYEHTAAAIAACDRIISTDTTVVHAAGAMGLRVDCLLSTPCMWVHSPWHKDKSPWYINVRLHRMPANGDWVRHLNHLTSQGVL
jgi:tetratricopeptide (TPR) repeat protein